jgi:hypothetical protein
MFLFAMGAAMPFSLSKKLKQNDSMWKTAGQIFYRGFLLFVFAVFLQHIRPWNISSESQNLSWFLALAGFVVLMLIYTDWNRHVNLIKSRILTASGWIGAVLMMFFIPFENPAHFSLNRSDIIILILANMAVICAFLWLITRNNLRLKMVSIAIVAAIMIGGSVSGWVQDFQQNATVFWLFRWDFLYYAILVLAGTMAGEIIQAKKDGIDISTLSSKIDVIFERESDFVRSKFHSFRENTNHDSHIYTSNNTEDVKNFANGMMTFLYSQSFSNN